MVKRIPWEPAVGFPAAALSATLLTFAISAGGDAQGLPDPPSGSPDPQSCSAPGHNKLEPDESGGHEKATPGHRLGHCDDIATPSEDPPADPPQTDPPTDPPIDPTTDSDDPLASTAPASGGGGSGDPSPESDPSNTTASPDNTPPAPASDETAPIGDAPIDDANFSPNDDLTVQPPVAAPPVGDPAPPALGEVLPESDGPPSPLPATPIMLPNGGNGGLADASRSVGPASSTVGLIAAAIGIASASALHYAQRRANASRSSKEHVANG
jgi:hypothetical protein